MRRFPIRLGIRHTALIAVLALSPSCPEAQTRNDVDLALVLAVDCSVSIDVGEFDLQTGGMAGAFRDTEVIAAIERWATRGIAVSVVLWSGRNQQRVGVGWTRIGNRRSAAALAARIEKMGRPMHGETAVGEGLRFAIRQFEHSPFTSVRRIIDVAGDGRSNVGADPDRLRDLAVVAGIIINGLAILNDDMGLDRYYAEHVIGGPDAFVMTAHDFDDFARAMRLKLLREIRGAPLG